MRSGLKEQISNRLATSQGHVAAIQRMVNQEYPLLQTIHQIQAVRSALYSVEELLVREALTQSLGNCQGKLPQEVFAEVSGVLGMDQHPIEASLPAQ